MTGQWFSPGTLFCSTNKTDCHDITEILLKVALNTITLTLDHVLIVIDQTNLQIVNVYVLLNLIKKNLFKGIINNTLPYLALLIQKVM